MSDQMHLESSTRTAEAARTAWQADGRRRPAWLLYAGIAVVSVLTGAGATVLALRPGPVPSPGTPPPAAEYVAHQNAPDAAATQVGEGVYISPARQQLIGVRTAAVEHRALETTIRTVGVLQYDETRVAEMHTKIAGWIERVGVDFVGKSVRRGQMLFTVYSPELVATQKEYLLALRAAGELGRSVYEETRLGADGLLAATRERLKLWDVSDAQIERLEQTGEVQKTMSFSSPFNGVVLERNAFPGHYIGPETAVFKIADLSTIWVHGQLFESELRRVAVGQQAHIEFPYGQTTRSLQGRITFIYPDVDPMTRRGRVRIELRNPGLELKPESYVTVVIHTPGGHELAVPREAVIDTGAKRYTILARGNGYFEPREIQIGDPVDGFYPVVGGLDHGDVVVTSAQFLIDSETNLQEAMQSMVGHGHESPAAPAGGDDRSPPPDVRAGPTDLQDHSAQPPASPAADAPVRPPAVDHSNHQPR
jgi:RND family efflux transporter MFP subunit